ncbi:hypothetical protein E2C01_027181 [Portunus trituberculatus]|uniref:Uncharacterized protein n=1 Tax=Portunus trituberculatus TaxID=210409 RepID=A0A5B7EK61_PORTR|nr:hypothetical protein [Portunus trituberculatus]
MEKVTIPLTTPITPTRRKSSTTTTTLPLPYCTPLNSLHPASPTAAAATQTTFPPPHPHNSKSSHTPASHESPTETTAVKG